MRSAAARRPPELRSTNGVAAEPAGAPAPVAAIRTIGLLARGRHRDLCLDAVLELARRSGRLPSCVDLLAPGWPIAAAPDLILLGRTADEPLSDRYRQIGDAILRRGAPLLLLPHAARGPLFGPRALIVWDGSFAAIAALRQAALLLAHSDEILLIDSADGQARASISHAFAFLETLPGARRIDVTRLALETAPLVLEAARMARADYIVIGGFGRWNALPGLLYGNADATFVRSRVPILVGHNA